MPLAGLRVRLERTVDKPCVACGATMRSSTKATTRTLQACDAQIVIGTAAGCRPDQKFLSETVRLFGVPDEPVIIKDASHSQSGFDDMKRADSFPPAFCGWQI